jgi:hypothetical protein
MCDENVDSDCSMLCSSPMSARTPSKKLSLLSSDAGTISPDMAIRVIRPSVLSVTVLPPVFGPVIDERIEIAPERDIHRHDLIRRYQRMTRKLMQLRNAVAPHLRRAALHPVAEPGLREDEIELSRRRARCRICLSAKLADFG